MSLINMTRLCRIMIKQKSNVTIYDIAKHLNVSPSTVSRVMNNSTHPVKEELRRKILSAAKEMGYVPNLQARNLKNRSNPTVGVILPSIDNPFYPSIVRGIEDEMVQRNYYLTISSCDRDRDRTNYSIQNMLAANVEGIISVYLDEMSTSLKTYAERGGRVINVVANGMCYPNVHTILVDKAKECMLAMDYLTGNGHKKIALLLNEVTNSIRSSRLQGYKEGLDKSGIPINDAYIYIYGRDVPITVSPVESAKVGYLLAGELLKRSPEVTGIVCMNDNMSLGVLKAVNEAGRRIPEDYSLISFDDLVFAEAIVPPLTTVGLDKYEWGRSLAKYYFSLLKQDTVKESVAKEEDILIPSKLIIRQSAAVIRSPE